jgi:hypothetical protein
LGNCQVMHTSNLTGGPYIDMWRLERVSSGHKCRRRSPVTDRGQTLYFLNGYLMYSGPSGAMIRKTGSPSALFRILPPTDKVSWQQFVTRLGPYQAGRSRQDLSRWLGALPGPTLRIPGGRLTDLQVTPSGLRGVLSVPRNVHISSGIHGLATPPGPGRYILSYDLARGTWTVASTRSPLLRARVYLQQRLLAYSPATVQVVLHNLGRDDWYGPVVVELGRQPVYTEILWIPRHASWTGYVAWTPRWPGSLALNVRAGSRLLWAQRLVVRAAPRPLNTLLTLSVLNRWAFLEGLVLAILLTGGSYTLWKRAYYAA